HDRLIDDHEHREKHRPESAASAKDHVDPEGHRFLIAKHFMPGRHDEHVVRLEIPCADPSLLLPRFADVPNRYSLGGDANLEGADGSNKHEDAKYEQLLPPSRECEHDAGNADDKGCQDGEKS